MAPNEPRGWPLEPSEATRRAWFARAEHFIGTRLGELDDAPAVGHVGADGIAMAKQLSVPIPEHPHPGGIDALLDIVGRAADAALFTPGPGYLAYIPGGGLVSAALADYLSGHLNRFTGLAQAAPGLCRLEADVLAWLARSFGYGSAARGLLTSGGSTANLSAIITARWHGFGDSGDFRSATAYTSTQAHHSVLKSMRLAGIPTANVRAIAVDERFRLDAGALAAAIAADRSAGRTPFLVVSSAGTTNTGAVDPLPAIADVCARENVWHHVDGAYGGAFVLCERGRRTLAGIERADSIAFDPHKGMFLPYGTGCLLVREGSRLRDAHHLDAAYLQDFTTHDEALPSPTEYGPELSRDARGLRVWLSLMLFGAAAFRDALHEKLELAEAFHSGLQSRIDDGAPLEIVDAPQLSIVAFRLTRRSSEPLEVWNRRNAALLRGINARKRVYLSSTALPATDGDAFTLRVCVLSFRTHAERVACCLQDLDAALADLA